MASALPEITKTLEKLNVPDFSIGSTHVIEVTHINNPDSFYVRPVIYYKHMNNIEARGEQATGHEATLKALLIFKSKTIDKYVRGRIERWDEANDLFTIFATDYGFYESAIPCKDIYKPLSKFWPDALASHCKLGFCFPLQGEWDQQAIDAMRSYIGESEGTRITVENVLRDQYVVKLVNSPPDLALFMALAGYTALGLGNPKVSLLTAPPAKRNHYAYKTYQVGEKINVRMLHGRSLQRFLVAEVNDYLEYKAAKENFEYASKRANMVSDDELRPGLPVSVYSLTDGNHERGVVVDVAEMKHKARVRCVDTGAVFEVSRGHIKVLPASFLARPPAAIDNETKEDQYLDYRLQWCMHPGAKFAVTVLRVGKEFETPYLVRIEAASAPRIKRPSAV